MRDALDLILPKLAKVIRNLSQFALKYKDLPTLGFTCVYIQAPSTNYWFPLLISSSHYQAAQPITVGRRAVQWIHDLEMDLEDIEYVRAGLKFRGAQGTTGTQVGLIL
jgi:adenylosuccinate lyase